MTASIRAIEPDDADEAMRLSAELGYPADRGTMLRRMQQIAGDRNRAVLVACVDGDVAGWIDLSIEYHLQTEPVARYYANAGSIERDQGACPRVLSARGVCTGEDIGGV